MARKKPDEKTRAKLDELEGQIADMEGINRSLADDLLSAYVTVWADYERLNDTLGRDGLLIETEKGSVKHPAFDMRRNTINQIADLANKIKRFVKDTPVEQTDDFTDF